MTTKRVLSILLCLVLFAGTLPVAFAAESPLTWTVVGNEITISACDTAATGAVEVPAAIDGKPVTSIAAKAFNKCKTITSVTLPESVRSIGQSAFDGCYALESVNLPAKITTINDYTFRSCLKLTAITLHEGITTIGQSAFGSCSALQSIRIPDSVRSIGTGAFLGCTALGAIEIGTGNTAYTTQNGVLYNKEMTRLLICPTQNPIGDYVIPDTVTTIELGAFRDCPYLTTLTIPGSLRSVPNQLVMRCKALTSVTILSGVTSVGDNAFMECSALKSVTLPDTLTSIGYGAFESAAIEELIIPDSVRTIGGSAFRYCNKLQVVHLPGSMKTVESLLFYDCYNLTMVKIPDGVTSIGMNAFYCCESLSSIKLPDSVQTIAANAFAGCRATQYIHLPAGVTTIGNGVFSDTPLAHICCGSSAEYVRTYAWENGKNFSVCDGKHLSDIPLHERSTAAITAAAELGSFADSNLSVLATKADLAESGMDFVDFEFDITPPKGMVFEEEQTYLIRVMNEKNEIVQPNAGYKVTVRIPIPNGVDPEGCRIFHVVDSAKKTTESFRLGNGSMRVEGGFFVIEVSHFSPFVLFAMEDEVIPEPPTEPVEPDSASITILGNPGTATLRYGEERLLRVLPQNIPDSARIVWQAEAAGIVTLQPTKDGMACTVSAQKTGTVKVSAKVVTADGKTSAEDSETFHSKAGFVDKLTAFFKKLFGGFSTVIQEYIGLEKM